MRKLVLATVNLRNKFDMPRFTCSKDMMNRPYMPQVTLATPIWDSLSSEG